MPSPTVCQNIHFAEPSKPVVVKYVGDTWVFPLTLTNPPAEGSTTTPYDLTGFTPSGTLWIGTAAHAATIQAQSDTNQLSQGQCVITVSSSITSTAPADPMGAIYFNTRLQVSFTDSLGNTETYGVIPINVRAP